jgi:hypothetical protein
MEPSKQPYAPMVIAIMASLVLFLLTVGFSAYSVEHSQKQWCTTLSLLTAVKVQKPADPAKNPSRVEAYTLYNAFSVLKKKYGCD